MPEEEKERVRIDHMTIDYSSHNVGQGRLIGYDMGIRDRTMIATSTIGAYTSQMAHYQRSMHEAAQQFSMTMNSGMHERLIEIFTNSTRNHNSVSSEGQNTFKRNKGYFSNSNLIWEEYRNHIKRNKPEDLDFKTISEGITSKDYIPYVKKRIDYMTSASDVRSHINGLNSSIKYIGHSNGYITTDMKNIWEELIASSDNAIDDLKKSFGIDILPIIKMVRAITPIPSYASLLNLTNFVQHLIGARFYNEDYNFKINPSASGKFSFKPHKPHMYLNIEIGSLLVIIDCKSSISNWEPVGLYVAHDKDPEKHKSEDKARSERGLLAMYP